MCPVIFVCFSFILFFLLLLLTTLFSDMMMMDDEASILTMHDRLINISYKSHLWDEFF
jgi:hypothetical protein